MTLLLALLAAIGPAQNPVPVLLQESPAARAPVRGVLIDKGTREPVAGARVGVSQKRVFDEEWPCEYVWTDEKGRFVTERAFVDGNAMLSASAGVPAAPNRSGSLPFWFGPRNGDRSFRPFVVDLGVRHDLEIALPSGRTVDDLVADRRERVAAGRGIRRPLEFHPGERPWVWVDSDRRPGSIEVLLRLATRDGFHAVELRVPDSSGTLRVRLEPRGVVAGLIRGPVECPVRAVVLRFDPVLDEPGDDREEFSAKVVLDRDFRLEWIEPGVWSVNLASDYFPDQTMHVQVTPLRVTSLPRTLGPALQAGTLCIRVSEAAGDVREWSGPQDSPWLLARVDSASGRALATIHNTSFGGPGVTPWERVERDGRFVHEATLDDVPEGELRVVVDSGRLLDRRHASVRMNDCVVFRYLEEIPRSAHGFHVTHESSGEPLSDYRLHPVEPDRYFPLSWHPMQGGWHSASLPEGEPFEWALWDLGCKRVYGDRHSFRPAVAPEVGMWTTVELERGFGIRLRASDATGSPMSRVKVGFDGRLYWTDAAGVAYLSSPDPDPERRVDFDGWRIAGGNVRSDGVFQASGFDLELIPELRVILE